MSNRTHPVPHKANSTDTPTPPAVHLADAWKVYTLGKTRVEAVRGVDITITEGDFVSIAGPSGSGKSTILNLIGCIDTPTRGTVDVVGRRTSGLSDREITRLRHEAIGFIFQSFNLIPVLSVAENIEFPLLLAGVSRAERRETVQRLMAMTGLESHARHKPDELSGGQRQRVAIARALVNRPRLVIADEPTANLDSETGQEIIEAMLELNREAGVSFLFSTHNPEITRYAGRILRLRDGTIVGETG